jgi:hypothetical protein
MPKSYGPEAPDQPFSVEDEFEVERSPSFGEDDPGSYMGARSVDEEGEAEDQARYKRHTPPIKGRRRSGPLIPRSEIGSESILPDYSPVLPAGAGPADKSRERFFYDNAASEGGAVDEDNLNREDEEGGLAEEVIKGLVRTLCDSGPAGVRLLHELCDIFQDMGEATMRKDHESLVEAADEAHETLSKLID